MINPDKAMETIIAWSAAAATALMRIVAVFDSTRTLLRELPPPPLLLFPGVYALLVGLKVRNGAHLANVTF